ncbi:MAG: DMT family transporter [Peptococcaceae bacterium]
MKKNISYLFIAAGASLWGLIGIFVEALKNYGFSPIEIVAIRALTASGILIIYSLLKDKSLLRVKIADLRYFLATGILSIVFFNWCYFTAIQEVSLSVAVVLLYTAPAFVTILSRFIFKERITLDKIVALAILFIGCSFVVGLLPALEIKISTFGLLVGLGSGIGYALYSIFGKMASEKYSSITITTYTFIFAGVALLPLSRLWEKYAVFNQGEVLIYSLGLGLVPTSLAYILYTIGLTEVEAGRASIIANIEPVVAMLIGVCFLGDVLTGGQVLGAVAVLTAAFLIQKSATQNSEQAFELKYDRKG